MNPTRRGTNTCERTSGDLDQWGRAIMKRNALAVHGLDPAPAAGRFPLLTLVVLVTAVFACSIYANLSFAVSRPSDLRYLPPFEPRVDGNMNRHLGGEYLQMARSLTAGEGFADPFDEPTGPTAWQPPVP